MTNDVSASGARRCKEFEQSTVLLNVKLASSSTRRQLNGSCQHYSIVKLRFINRRYSLLRGPKQPTFNFVTEPATSMHERVDEGRGYILLFPVVVQPYHGMRLLNMGTRLMHALTAATPLALFKLLTNNIELGRSHEIPIYKTNNMYHCIYMSVYK